MRDFPTAISPFRRGSTSSDSAAGFFPLHVCGAVMLAILATAAGVFSQAAMHAVGVTAESFRWIMVGGLALAYWQGERIVRALEGNPGLRRLVLVYGIALALVAALICPFRSTDLFIYVNMGWQQARYGLDPYAHRLVDTPHWLTDPMFHQEWLFVPAAYGCLFVRLTAWLCQLGGGDYLLTVILFKTFNLAVFGLLAAVLVRGAQDMKLPNQDRLLFLFLWNPVLLLYQVADCHNDLLMTLGVAIAVWCAVSGRWYAVFSALALGILAKYLPVVLIPFLGLYVYRRYGWWKTALSLAAALLVSALICWPYLEGLRQTHLESMGHNLTALNNSLAFLMYYPWELLEHYNLRLEFYDPVVQQAMKILFGGLGAIGCGWLGWRRLRQPADEHQLVMDVVLIQLLIILGSPKYYPWYVAAFLPLAWWLPEESRCRRVVGAVGICQLLSFTFVDQAHGLNALATLLLPVLWALRSQTAAHPSITPRVARVVRPWVVVLRGLADPGSNWGRTSFETLPRGRSKLL